MHVSKPLHFPTRQKKNKKLTEKTCQSINHFPFCNITKFPPACSIELSQIHIKISNLNISFSFLWITLEKKNNTFTDHTQEKPTLNCLRHDLLFIIPYLGDIFP